MNDHLDQQVTDTFRKLNAPHERRAVSRFGIYMAWASLLLLAGVLCFIAIYVNDLDQQSERVRLHQSVTQVEKNIETHLTRTADMLRKASIRLINIPSLQTSYQSVELAATSLMKERREVMEISIVDPNYLVTRHWVNATNNTIVTQQVGDVIESGVLKNAIDDVFRGDNLIVSEPYTLANVPFAFVNIFVPTASSTQLLMARINLTRLINETAELTDNNHYVFFVEKHGEPLIARTHTPDGVNALRYGVPMTIFNHPDFELVGLSYEHTLFNTNNLNLWTFIGLSILLVTALFLLLHYQRKQHGSHQRLSAEYALRVAISESAMAGLRVTDRTGRILFVNETFMRLVDYRADELIGRAMPYPYWDDSVTAMKENILSHPNEPIQQTLEIRVRRKDGTVFDGQMNVSPLLNESKRLIGWVGELYDITEQKRARERMRAAHERFTRVVHSMNSAICVIREQQGRMNLLFANTPYEHLFGRDTQGAERIIDLLNSLPPSIAREGIYDEKSQRWFDARYQVMTWTDDENAIMVIATDITQRRETELALEAQLRRSENTQRLVTMGEMASSLAHELNQPLAAISNYASGAQFMLQAGKLSDEDTVGALEKISKQARRAAAIIKRIRGFAKRSDAQLTPVTADHVVSETMELANLQAAKLRSDIKVNIAPDLPLIMGDAVMLEQLLLNLLKNAMESARSVAGEARISVELDVGVSSETPDVVAFQVIDHGPGITDENKQRLFDAFYSTKSEGMGMGLNICRSIVEVHHGRILVTDTPGGGATFTFTVPIAPHVDSPESQR